MVVKEAWRVGRERGAQHSLDEGQRARLREAWSVGRAMGTVLGAALWLTLVAVVVKLLALTWAWVLS